MGVHLVLGAYFFSIQGITWTVAPYNPGVRPQVYWETTVMHLKSFVITIEMAFCFSHQMNKYFSPEDCYFHLLSSPYSGDEQEGEEIQPSFRPCPSSLWCPWSPAPTLPASGTSQRDSPWACQMVLLLLDLLLSPHLELYQDGGINGLFVRIYAQDLDCWIKW